MEIGGRPMLEFGRAEIALLICAIVVTVAFYLEGGTRASKMLGYVAGVCLLIGIVTGYLLVGLAFALAALLASAIVQAVKNGGHHHVRRMM
jgi:hypothetical protein